MTLARRCLALLALVVLAAACGARDGDRLRVDAAASLGEVARELADLHAARTGRPAPRVNLGGSGELARQIEAARKTDVFLSAGVEEVDRLEDALIVALGSRRALCGNALVVVAREPDADFTPDRLLEADRVAVAHPELVPAGRYAAAWLRDRELLDALASRMTRSSNVRAALAAVGSGAARYGVVYASDAAAAPELSVVWRVPADEAPPIRYTGCAIVGSPREEEAADFLMLAVSPEGQAIFARHGFAPRGGE